MGGDHACVLRPDASIKCWGRNESGQLGLGHDKAVLTAQLVPSLPDVKGLLDAKMLAAGQGHTCAVRTSGKVVCWGDNSDGEVGIVPPKDVLVLHPVALTGKFTAIGVGEEHSCALHEDGSVWCWGDNLHGNLGDGTKKASPQPVQVLGSAQK